MKHPMQPESLILASGSPRRAELLREAGYSFEVVEPPFLEPQFAHPHVAPSLHAESLAYFKACSVAKDRPDATILAADTIAAHQGDIVGKAVDEPDAFRILRRLAGTTHSVITGLALVHMVAGRRLLQHAASTVHLRNLSDEAIRAYLSTGAWRGKAGAYGVQDHDDPFVERVIGSFTNVVGLPMELVGQMLEHWMGHPQG